MAQPPRRPEDDMANANNFFGEGSSPVPPNARAEAENATPIGDGYEILGDEPPAPAPSPPPVMAAPKRSKPSARQDGEEGTKVKTPKKPIPEPSVSEVWSRWGEWGTTLIVLAVVGVATLWLFNMANNSSGRAAFLTLLVGGAIFVALSYPIAVTMERPIRMTPEQALKDYYGAASHHFPQYRRMWLLLSDTGKASREFESFAAFRSYWKHRMNRIRGNSVKATTPLAFSVSDYRGDKSAGQTSLEASYTVAIGPRGGEASTKIPITTSFAKGPDGMWYLNEGTLPETSASDR